MVCLMARLRHFVPILLIGAAIVATRVAGLQDHLSFAALGADQTVLRGFVAAQPVLAPLAYVALYAAVVTISLPVSVWMSIAAGLMFGLAPGTVYAVIGASLGAIGLFLIARTTLGDLLANRAGRLLDRVRPGLQRDGFSYLLALRLLPIIPFWMMNLAPALAGMRLTPYAVATVLGIIPATAVCVSLGAGLGDALATGQTPHLSVLFSRNVLLPLAGLAALALAPVGWRVARRTWRVSHGEGRGPHA
jgi:uncharacterized membrane protein YdjX (TVP38/TMEM64 family)